MNTVLCLSRKRHNGDTGADVQQGPAPRILFRLRPCVNLFLLSLVDTYPPLRRMLTSWHVATPDQCMYLDIRGFLRRPLFRPGLYHKDRIP